jgi:hypothetical protein
MFASIGASGKFRHFSTAFLLCKQGRFPQMSQMPQMRQGVTPALSVPSAASAETFLP